MGTSNPTMLKALANSRAIRDGIGGGTADGRITVDDRAPDATDGAGKPENAMWNQIDPTTGEQVAVWRWDDTAWVDMPIAETLLPKVNLAEGVYGRLKGEHLEGAVITGRGIQTDAADRKGIKWTSSGIQAYGTNGEVSWQVDATTGLMASTGNFTAKIREVAPGVSDLISTASLGAFPLQTHTENALWPALRFEAGYEGQPAGATPAHIHGASSGSLTFAPGSKPNPPVGQFYQSGTGSISSSQFNFRASDAKLTSWYDYGNGTGMASLAEGSAAQIYGSATRSAFLTFENNRNYPADKKRHFAKVKVARDGVGENGNSAEVELSRWTDDYTSGSPVTSAAASVLLDRLGNINLTGTAVTVNGNRLPRVAQGTFAVPELIPNGSYVVTIEMPAGRFTSNPTIMFANASPRISWSVDSITTTSFRARLFNFTASTTGSGTTTSWVAIEA